MSLTPHQMELVRVNGQLVERDVLGIVKKIQEYDPNLKVQYLESASSVGEAPYRIVETCRDGIERLVFSVWVLDESVLQRLFAADNQRWNVLSNLEQNNNKVREQQNRRFKEEALGSAREVTNAVLSSPKSTYTVPEDVLLGERGNPNTKVKFRDTPGPTRDNPSREKSG